MPEESTTPDLVRITRRRFEAGSRRDVDAVLSFYARNAVFDASDAGLGTFESANAIRAFLEDWWGTYDEYENAPEEITQVGEDVVLVVNTLIGHLPGSGEPLRLHNAYIFRFEDELIVRWTAYQDIEKARADAERLGESRP